MLDHVDGLRRIPAIIIQGRYDMVCPLQSAHELHMAWPEAEYQIVPDAGHGAFEPGIAAALVAAAGDGTIGAVVSRGGRPDLAGDALPEVTAPTLLIVGGLDDLVLDLNRQAMGRMRCDTALEIVPGATHLFEEPGTLEQVSVLASGWFTQHLR